MVKFNYTRVDVFLSRGRVFEDMSLRRGFEVTFKTGAETGHVISQVMFSAITAPEPLSSLMILRRLVHSMPRSYRDRVSSLAAEYYKQYYEEVSRQLLEGLPDPSKIRDLEARARVEEARRSRSEAARYEALVEAMLSALGDVGSTAGFWFAVRPPRRSVFEAASNVEG